MIIPIRSCSNHTRETITWNTILKQYQTKRSSYRRRCCDSRIISMSNVLCYHPTELNTHDDHPTSSSSTTTTIRHHHHHRKYYSSNDTMKRRRYYTTMNDFNRIESAQQHQPNRIRVVVAPSSLLILLLISFMTIMLLVSVDIQSSSSSSSSLLSTTVTGVLFVHAYVPTILLSRGSRLQYDPNNSIKQHQRPATTATMIYEPITTSSLSSSLLLQQKQQQQQQQNLNVLLLESRQQRETFRRNRDHYYYDEQRKHKHLSLPQTPQMLISSSSSTTTTTTKFGRTAAQKRSSWIDTSTTSDQQSSSLFYSPVSDVITSSSSSVTKGPPPTSSSVHIKSSTNITPSTTKRTIKYHRQRGVLGFQIHNNHIHNNNHNDHISSATTTSTTSSTMQHQQQESHNPNMSFNQTVLSSTAGTTRKIIVKGAGHHDESGNSRTRLKASVISNVDSMSWNVPEPLMMNNNNNHFNMNQEPWIQVQPQSQDLSTDTTSLTDDTIDTLTVLQLKNELGLRSLKKVGNKYLLQNRLKQYLIEHHATSKNNKRIPNDNSNRVSSFLEQELPTWGIDSSSLFPDQQSEELQQQVDNDNSMIKSAISNSRSDIEEPLLNVDSLQEWARTVDLEPLLHRREAIHREKLEGPPKKEQSIRSSSPTKQLPSDLRLVIQKMFDQPSSIYSNREVKQMYAAAKHADQIGDRILSKRILYELKIATPNDARIYRRLARMELEDNNIDIARSILNDGIQLHPENAYLWHGLGQLEGSLGNITAQRTHWQKAIDVDPYVPHSYHALGTLDHTNGCVAQAMKVLKKGVQYCPTNHRLHHALGDLYRDAKMFALARISYNKAIQYGPPVSHGFAYTALSYVAYEEGNIEQCRHYLRKAVHYNNGRHANGWVALAQLEESEGNIDAARTACMVGIGQYERGLIEQSRRTIQQQQQTATNQFNSTTGRTTAFSDHRTLSLSENPVTLRNKILQSIPTYRSGDRFYNVYRNWLRLEQRYGTIDAVEEVYERAIVAFPHEFKIMMDVAQYYVKFNLFHRAREVYTLACVRVNHYNNSIHADPYRLFAEFEMQLGNYEKAQKILYSGVMTLTKYTSTATVQNTYRLGLPQLFLTWAVCEWHLENLSHAEKLFDYTLRLTSPIREEIPELQSMLLYTMSLFEYHRKNMRRAQHYIGLCLKENALPGGNVIVWDLWATIAHETGNIRLAQQCQEHSTSLRNIEEQQQLDGVASRYNNIHIEDTVQSLAASLKRSRSTTTNDRSEICQLLRRDPWHLKIFDTSSHDTKNRFINLGLLPQEGKRGLQKQNNKDNALATF